MPVFCPGSRFKLKPLSLRDRKLFERYLHFRERRLAAYSFANIFIWQGLFKIYWTVVDDALCVFFKDACGYFLFLPPLSVKSDPAAASLALRWMNGVNANPAVSRIENIEELEAQDFRRSGLDCFVKSCDYVCLRSEMSALAGDRFKSKRADCNHFVKHNRFIWRPYRRQDHRRCRDLYNRWAQARRQKYADHLYRGMLADSRSAFLQLLENYRVLSPAGRVVVIDGRVAACTFGCPVSAEMFAVIFEVCEPGLRGLSQFVFRRYCQELDGYRLINVMDDSGLESLKRVKMSYHPRELIKSYVARCAPERADRSNGLHHF